MQYFIFSPTHHCCGTPPLTREGELVDSLLARGITAEQGWMTVPDDDDEPDVTDAAEMPDVLSLYAYASEVAVSPRCKDMLQKLRMGEEIVFIPVVVKNRAEKALATYFFVGSTRRHYVVDHDHAGLEYWPDFAEGKADFVEERRKNAIYEVYDWALVNENIPESDLFKVETNVWIATERVTEMFEKERVTGCQWELIWSTEDAARVAREPRPTYLSEKELKNKAEEWKAWIRSNWHWFRTVARDAFEEDGRGAIGVDMSYPQVLHLEQFGYLSRAMAEETRDPTSLELTWGHVEVYDPAREIVFLFSHPRGRDNFVISVLTEWPDGTPKPSPKELDERWCGFERTCPKCQKRFIGLKDRAECPDCDTEFSASGEEYRSFGRTAIDPIVAEKKKKRKKKN